RHSLHYLSFSSTHPPSPKPPLLPYTTLFRSQTPSSVFTLFFDSLFARRIAMASLALALLLGVYVISSEQMSEPATFVSNLSSELDRKSTRLNSSHQIISYAVFCLKKKNIHIT